MTTHQFQGYGIKAAYYEAADTAMDKNVYPVGCLPKNITENNVTWTVTELVSLCKKIVNAMNLESIVPCDDQETLLSQQFEVFLCVFFVLFLCVWCLKYTARSV